MLQRRSLIIHFTGNAVFSFSRNIRWQSTNHRGVPGSASSTPISGVNVMSDDYYRECNRFVSIRVQKDRETVSSSRAVQWKCCRCNQWSNVGYKNCIHCKTEAGYSHRHAFPPSRQVVLFSGAWICEECGMANQKSTTPRSTDSSASRTKFFCDGCGSSFKGVRVWTCPTCYSLNARGSAQCTTCFCDRPISWKCFKCDKQLSIFTKRCHGCGYEQTSKKTKGTQFCEHCGTLNESRSELCETCVAPLDSMRSLVPSRKSSATSSPNGELHHKEQISRVDGTVASTPQEPRDAKVLKNSTNREAGIPLNSESNGAWWCPNCNIVLRRNATFCDICLQSRGGSSNALSRAPVTTSPGDWQCPYCRQFRRVHETTCCGKVRVCPTGYWLCQNCYSTNRNERQYCLGCNCPPPDVAWQCSTCARSNEVSSFLCRTCYSPHPVRWRCAECAKNNHYTALKCKCGAEKPTPPDPVLCTLCGAPNAPQRKSCFRCRGRLVSGQWKCSECQHDKNSRTSTRCEQCLTPKKFNMAQITWVCDVCNTAIDSGGDLPERLQCPKCSSLFSEDCLKFPTRWICPKCKLEANRSTSSSCMECGQTRKMAPFRCPAVCPHCFDRVVIDETEECSSCGRSLSALLSEPGELVQGINVFSETSSDTFLPTRLIEDDRGAYSDDEISI